jgi:hypothetical protein
MKRNISNMDLANEALFKSKEEAKGNDFMSGKKSSRTDIYWAALLHISSDLSDILNAENLGRDVKKIIEEIRKKYIADYEE